jgi:hypothetical protein
MSTGFHGHSGVFVRLKKFADTGLCIGHLGSLQFVALTVKYYCYVKFVSQIDSNCDSIFHGWSLLKLCSPLGDCVKN